MNKLGINIKALTKTIKIGGDIEVNLTQLPPLSNSDDVLLKIAVTKLSLENNSYHTRSEKLCELEVKVNPDMDEFEYTKELVNYISEALNELSKGD